MLIPYVLLVILLFFSKDEVDAKWIYGIFAFLIISFICAYNMHISGIIFVVPVVIVDIILILKIFGGDITIR